MNNNHYETVFILTPVLSEPQMKDAVKDYKAALTEAGAEIINEEVWGLKKLTYPIQHKKTGFYQLPQFTAPGDAISKLETVMRRDEKVMRFLTTRMDKYAVEYNDRRRKGLVGKKGKKTEA
jgi:small subunit ribosomal protein S6